MTWLKNVLSWVQVVFGIIAAVIALVERPGEGNEKRKEAIARFIEALDAAKVPGWVKWLFSRETFAGWLIDMMVDAANETGFFESPSETSGSGSQAS